MAQIAADQSGGQDARLQRLDSLLNRRTQAVNFRRIQYRTVLLLLLFENLTRVLGCFFLGDPFDS